MHLLFQGTFLHISVVGRVGRHCIGYPCRGMMLSTLGHYLVFQHCVSWILLDIWSTLCYYSETAGGEMKINNRSTAVVIDGVLCQYLYLSFLFHSLTHYYCSLIPLHVNDIDARHHCKCAACISYKYRPKVLFHMTVWQPPAPLTIAFVSSL